MTDIEGLRDYGTKWKVLDSTTYQAYFGHLLFAGGVYRLHAKATKHLSFEHTSRNIFLATMSLKLFYMISRVIRCDSQTT